MTRPQLPSNRTPVVRCVVLLVTLVLTTPAWAGGFLDNSAPKEPTKPGWAVPAKRMPVEGEGQSAMLAQLENAEMRLREAIQNAATAEYQYTRARTRRYPRGEALMEIQNRVAEMNKEKSEAGKDFVALVDEARAAGVPAGTLMPYMDLADDVRSGRVGVQ